MKNIKKVYVITDGDYSDYHIVAIFAKKADAVHVAKKYGCENVEEYVLGKLSKDNLKDIFLVRIDKAGNVVKCEIDNDAYSFQEAMKKSYFFDVNKNLLCNVFANNDVHAIKIVNERRIQLIASDRWKQ